MSVKRAVVTGAGSGIGRATASRLLDEGYEVVAIGRRGETLQQTADDLTGGERFRPLVVNVTDGEALAGALEGIGRVCTVVANAGICQTAWLDDAHADQVWKDVLEVNLDGVWNTFRAVLPVLEDGAHAVVVSSGLGKLGRAGYGAYTASKHGVLGLVKCLAAELASRRITINAVCPGWVATDMAETDLLRAASRSGSSVEEIRQAALAGIPLGRFVDPDEVAALICWLLSDNAAAVTGQAYNISCGEFFA